MNPKAISCENVDEGDLDTRYLAGTLSDSEAEAFEGHFFGCERCWALVQQGLGVQAAYESAPQIRRLALSPRQWRGLAAAAVLVLTFVGIRSLGPHRESVPQGDVLRGRAGNFVVVSDVKPDLLTAAWPRLSQADVYQVRLYGPEGTLVLQRETAETTLSVPLDAAGAPQGGTEVFWQIQAFDALRNPVAQSALTRAGLSDSTP